jgi:hypothetical protein
MLRLAVLDAIAITAGVFGAFVFRAAVRSYDSLAPDHILSVALPTLPLCLVLALLSLWAAGLYGDRPASPAAIVVALAWSTAVVAFVALYRTDGPAQPLTIVAVGYLLSAGLVIAGRRFYEARVATTRATP